MAVASASASAEAAAADPSARDESFADVLWADLGAADASLRAAETQQSASWRVIGVSSAEGDPTRAAYAAFRSVAERALGRAAVAEGLAPANAGTEGAEEGGGGGGKGGGEGGAGAAGAAAGGREPGSAALGMLGEMGMGLRGARVAGAAPGGLPAALRALRAAAALGNATAQHTLGFLHAQPGLLGLARNDGVAALHGTY